MTHQEMHDPTQPVGKRVALYARVSTDDKGQDPEVQLVKLRKMAEIENYTVVAEYVDYASGKDGNRPRFKEMMSDARKHRFDAIMAVRVDRVMRSVTNLCNTVEELERYDIKLLFENFRFDPSDPNSRMMLTILSSIAEWERGIISKRTVDGMALARSKGSAIGRPAVDVPYTTVARMRIEGMGWQAISKAIGIPKSTLLSRREAIEARIDELRKGSEKVPPS